MSIFLARKAVVSSLAMRFLVLATFVAAFAYVPVWAFDNLVLPQISGLHKTYQAAAQMADYSSL
jgi:hypothetical protein